MSYFWIIYSSRIWDHSNEETIKSGLSPKCVRLAPNGTNLGLFKIEQKTYLKKSQIFPFGANLTLRKIAIWLSKNCQKLDIFSQKNAKIFHFLYQELIVEYCRQIRRPIEYLPDNSAILQLDMSERSPQVEDSRQEMADLQQRLEFKVQQTKVRVTWIFMKVEDFLSFY